MFFILRHSMQRFSCITKLTYPMYRCFLQNIPRHSCYLWIVIKHPHNRLAAMTRVAVDKPHDVVAYAFLAALHNDRYRSSNDYFGSDHGSLLRDHRKEPRADQILNDLYSMTDETFFLFVIDYWLGLRSIIFFLFAFLTMHYHIHTQLWHI